MTLSIRLCLVSVAAHYSHHLAAFNLAKGRSALLLRHLTAADESPLDHFLILHFLKFVFTPNIYLPQNYDKKSNSSKENLQRSPFLKILFTNMQFFPCYYANLC